MSSLVKLYVDQIQSGKITMEQVPAGLKNAVQAALDELQEK